jgi:MATE family multidrug resistance protein
MKARHWRISWARARPIVGLSLPIVLMLLVQNLIGLIIIGMVSPFGDAAVAGIGIASSLFSMFMAVLFGIDTAVQALVAQRIGAGEPELAGRILNDALAIAVVAGLLLIVLGYAAGPAIFHAVTNDPAVVARGLPYLNAALPMLLFLGGNFAFNAYRNGAGMPRYSLLVSVVQLACGTLFSYLLIFGALGLPQMETAGAGLGVTLAALLALLAHLLLALRIVPVPGFVQTRLNWPGVRTILKIGLPVGLQQCLVFVGTTVSFGIVGLLGTGQVAAMNVLLNVLLLSILLASGLGVAALRPSLARPWGVGTLRRRNVAAGRSRGSAPLSLLP